MVALSVSALLVVWRFFPRAVVPCALVLGPFAYLSGGPTLTEWRQELCGPGGALCDLLRHASWTQLLLGIGPRTLGEHGFSPEVLDPERASAHIRLIVENGVVQSTLANTDANYKTAFEATADAGLAPALRGRVAAVDGSTRAALGKPSVSSLDRCTTTSIADRGLRPATLSQSSRRGLL